MTGPIPTQTEQGEPPLPMFGADDVRMPERIGKFQIIEPLSRGHMALVYKARQEAPDRLVALKIPRGGRLLSREARERFMREINLTAGLDHAGIVPVLETGEVDGVPYYTMPLVDGRSLERFVTEAKPALEARLALFGRVCEVVQTLHSRGLVHRDLKPIRPAWQRALPSTGHPTLDVTLGGSGATPTAQARVKSMNGARPHLTPAVSEQRPAIDGGIPPCYGPALSTGNTEEGAFHRMHEMIWANLLHLSFNMWEEAEDRIPRGATPHTRWVLNLRRERPEMQFDEKLWDELLQRMVAAKMNMVILDLGNAVKYQSHPEIAVRNAWTPPRLQREIAKLRRMGLEPIPKLNFSTTHDAWLGPYARCVSTDAYYAVCRDLIEEVCALFDRPRFFHLGMDEETASHQRYMRYAVMRQGELWWHDLQFLVDQVERRNVRAWIWSDYVWHHPEEFFRNMPKSVLQSNWYYGAVFNSTVGHVKAYRDLEAHGYDQVPTGSTWSVDENFAGTVRYCRRYVSPKRLCGFMQAPWLPTVRSLRQRHLRAIEVVGEVLRK